MPRGNIEKQHSCNTADHPDPRFFLSIGYIRPIPVPEVYPHAVVIPARNHDPGYPLFYASKAAIFVSMPAKHISFASLLLNLMWTCRKYAKKKADSLCCQLF
jgi:hypothetical protein